MDEGWQHGCTWHMHARKGKGSMLRDSDSRFESDIRTAWHDGKCMQHRTYAYRIPWTKWSGLVIVATGEVLACFRLRGGLSGKLRLDSSAKHCALLSVFGSRSIVFVLLSPGRIPSELLVVSAAGGLSVRGVQKSSVTCQ